VPGGQVGFTPPHRSIHCICQAAPMCAPPSNTRFLGPTRVFPSSISFGSSILQSSPECPTDRHTHRGTVLNHDVFSNSLPSRALQTMHAKTVHNRLLVLYRLFNLMAQLQKSVPCTFVSITLERKDFRLRSLARWFSLTPSTSRSKVKVS